MLAAIALALMASAVEQKAAPADALGAPHLAVLEFENELHGIDRIYFSDLVRGAVKKAAPALVVMTRENVVELLAASGTDLAACEGSCEVQTGRLLGADYVVSGRLTKVGSRLKLSLRIHDTRSSALLGTASAEGSTVEDLDDGVQRAAGEIAALAHAAPAPPRSLLPPFRAGVATWVGLGVSAAALGAGTVYGLKVRSITSGDQITQLNGAPVHSVSEVDQNRANGYAGTANILFVAAAAVAIFAVTAGFWGTR